MGKAHRATGKPRGRPPRIPFEFSQQILDALRKRIDPKTGLVRLWRRLARELGVSRSTIARRMVELRASGEIESVFVRVCPKVTIGYYRLKD